MRNFWFRATFSAQFAFVVVLTKLFANEAKKKHKRERDYQATSNKRKKGNKLSGIQSNSTMGKLI